MNKGVKKVRHSIEKRKRTRGLSVKDGPKKQIWPEFPQEEEKHGYYASFSEHTLSGNNKGNFPSGFILKGILSVMLFFGVALLTQADTAILQKPREWTSNALTEEFPFAKVNLWYQETFGTPLAFTPNQGSTEVGGEQSVLPVSGSIKESFQTNGKGLMIAPGEKADVTALHDGVVIFAGNDRETDQTVVLQHPDGSVTTYGFLSDVNVHLYQFVTSSQTIGQFTPTMENDTVFFAIEKNSDYIDPVQVIQVDDTP
ncbi:peptidoglycan DD-metalloendopeptidase family protein [Virgibacillus ainsalahensis]